MVAETSANAPLYCRFKDITGQRCSEFSHHDGLCYWHSDQEIKTGDDLRERLEARARTGEAMRYFKLRNTQLQNLSLVSHGSRHGYQLTHADLYRSDLRNAHLFRLDLSFSSLMKADLRGANLNGACLEHANLLGARFDEAKLHGVQWGEMVRQEKQGDHEKDPANQRQLYTEAEEIYRSLYRTLHTQSMEADGSFFYYRQMVVRRKLMRRYSWAWSLSFLVDLFCGYGEKPGRLLLASLVGIGGFALVFALLGLVYNGQVLRLGLEQDMSANVDVLLSALYFSVVTFTTLGYGDITPHGLSRFFAAGEAFSGSFTMALYVVVFVRKMGRGGG